VSLGKIKMNVDSIIGNSIRNANRDHDVSRVGDDDRSGGGATAFASLDINTWAGV
jgi:hypothetical protein